MSAERRGAYGMVIPDGVCGHYVADEGGEWWCRRPLDHSGSHSPQSDVLADFHAGVERRMAELSGQVHDAASVRASLLGLDPAAERAAALRAGRWADAGGGLQVRLLEERPC